MKVALYLPASIHPWSRDTWSTLCILFMLSGNSSFQAEFPTFLMISKGPMKLGINCFAPLEGPFDRMLPVMSTQVPTYIIAHIVSVNIFIHLLMCFRLPQSSLCSFINSLAYSRAESERLALHIGVVPSDRGLRGNVKGPKFKKYGDFSTVSRWWSLMANSAEARKSSQSLRDAET